MPLRLPLVYAITDPRGSGVPAQALVRQLFAAGLRAVQLRDKEASDGELLSAARAGREEARKRRGIFLVNDRVDIARIAGAGVHLGSDDLPAGAARRILGPSAPIGVSTHDIEAARRAFAAGEGDYVAFGPVFDSPTKRERAGRGLEALRRVAAGKTMPLVAIGGITLDRLEAIWDAGADSAAMVSAVNAPPAADSARRICDAARRRSLPRKIWLVGFMGSGKTTVGCRLAQRLGLPFFDLDVEIEKASGKPVRAIFEQEGEAAFRLRERAYVEGAGSISAGVFAAGGGTFASEENRRSILRGGTCVFLDVPFEALVERLQGKLDRPLFRDREQARALLEERLHFYRMSAIHVRLQGTETPEEAADTVLNELDERTCVI
jgi:thiamine-phosphate pyrophosphorylase